MLFCWFCWWTCWVRAGSGCWRPPANVGDTRGPSGAAVAGSQGHDIHSESESRVTNCTFSSPPNIQHRKNCHYMPTTRIKSNVRKLCALFNFPTMLAYITKNKIKWYIPRITTESYSATTNHWLKAMNDRYFRRCYNLQIPADDYEIAVMFLMKTNSDQLRILISDSRMGSHLQLKSAARGILIKSNVGVIYRYWAPQASLLLIKVTHV